MCGPRGASELAQGRSGGEEVLPRLGGLAGADIDHKVASTVLAPRNGFQSEGIRTVLHSEAHAKITCRLVGRLVTVV